MLGEMNRQDKLDKARERAEMIVDEIIESKGIEISDLILLRKESAVEYTTRMLYQHTKIIFLINDCMSVLNREPEDRYLLTLVEEFREDLIDSIEENTLYLIKLEEEFIRINLNQKK